MNKSQIEEILARLNASGFEYDIYHASGSMQPRGGAGLIELLKYRSENEVYFLLLDYGFYENDRCTHVIEGVNITMTNIDNICITDNRGRGFDFNAINAAAYPQKYDIFMQWKKYCAKIGKPLFDEINRIREKCRREV